MCTYLQHNMKEDALFWQFPETKRSRVSIPVCSYKHIYQQRLPSLPSGVPSISASSSLMSFHHIIDLQPYKKLQVQNLPFLLCLCLLPDNPSQATSNPAASAASDVLAPHSHCVSPGKRWIRWPVRVTLPGVWGRSGERNVGKTKREIWN